MGQLKEIKLINSPSKALEGAVTTRVRSVLFLYRVSRSALHIHAERIQIKRTLMRK